MSIVFALLLMLLGAAIALTAVALCDAPFTQDVKQESAARPHGVLLGKNRSHPFHQATTLALPAGHALMLGEARHSDDAILAAASVWDGALVFIDARGISQNLKRSGTIRFTPARPGSACYNPLQAIGAGPRAWIEALELARALLGPDAETRAPGFATLMLDHLMSAPVEKRHLPALRARLAHPKRLLSELASLWTHDFAQDQAPHAEIARIVAYLIHNPMKAGADFEHADRALRFLGDGRFAATCIAHDFDFSDLICGDGATSLLIEIPPDALDYVAPYLAGVLAQLVSACASAPDADPSGRAKKRPLLLVLEVDAHAALETFMQGAPLLPPHAARFGLSALTQSASIPRSLPLADFDAVAALGPQRSANAETLSVHIGRRRTWRPGNPFKESATWSNVLRGAIIEAPILKSRQFEKLASYQALILMGGARRRARAVTLAPGEPSPHSVVPREALSLPMPNWTAPPLERPPPPSAKPLAPASAHAGASSSTKIRKALSRKHAPAATALPLKDMSQL